MQPGLYAPTNGLEEFSAELADMRRRIADLARASAARSPYATWTPTLANFTGTVNVARFARLGGRTIHAWGKVTIATLAGGLLAVSIPVSASASYSTNDAVGGGWIFDGSGSVNIATWISGSNFVFAYQGSPYQAFVTNTVPLTLGASDELHFFAIYEAAA